MWMCGCDDDDGAATMKLRISWRSRNPVVSLLQLVLDKMMDLLPRRAAADGTACRIGAAVHLLRAGRAADAVCGQLAGQDFDDEMLARTLTATSL